MFTAWYISSLPTCTINNFPTATCVGGVECCDEEIDQVLFFSFICFPRVFNITRREKICLWGANLLKSF